MKRVLPVLLVILLLCGCGEAAKTWQEEYDLGVRYLSEGNYDEAILAFEAAIEIDPKRAEAYLSLADVYVAQGDLDAAREVLDRAVEAVGENEEVLAKIEEITAAGDPDASGQTEPTGGESGESGITRTVARTEREDLGDGSYAIDEYDANDVLLTRTYYYADGSVESRREYEYNANGKPSADIYYDANGTLIQRTEYEYDANGRVTRDNRYDGSGTLHSWCARTYNAAGQLQSLDERLADGTPVSKLQYDAQRNYTYTIYDDDGTYHATEYDTQGNSIRCTYYFSDGTVDWVDEYSG